MVLNLKQITIDEGLVILEDVDGGATSLTPEDMLKLQDWCYHNHVELVAMCYRPPELMFNRTQALGQEGNELL